MDDKPRIKGNRCAFLIKPDGSRVKVSAYNITPDFYKKAKSKGEIFGCGCPYEMIFVNKTEKRVSFFRHNYGRNYTGQRCHNPVEEEYYDRFYDFWYYFFEDINRKNQTIIINYNNHTLSLNKYQKLDDNYYTYIMPNISISNIRFYEGDFYITFKNKEFLNKIKDVLYIDNHYRCKYLIKVLLNEQVDIGVGLRCEFVEKKHYINSIAYNKISLDHDIIFNILDSTDIVLDSINYTLNHSHNEIVVNIESLLDKRECYDPKGREERIEILKKNQEIKTIYNVIKMINYKLKLLYSLLRSSNIISGDHNRIYKIVENRKYVIDELKDDLIPYDISKLTGLNLYLINVDDNIFKKEYSLNELENIKKNVIVILEFF